MRRGSVREREGLRREREISVKLVFAIINKDDAETIARALTEQGFASTQLGTTGSFLMADNVTILIGVDEERVHDVISVIREQCHSRRQTAAPGSGKLFGRAESSLEVIVGGATIFVVDIEHFERV
jgi:uncharacterized protein YaaQ